MRDAIPHDQLHQIGHSHMTGTAHPGTYHAGVPAHYSNTAAAALVAAAGIGHLNPHHPFSHAPPMMPDMNPVMTVPQYGYPPSHAMHPPPRHHSGPVNPMAAVAAADFFSSLHHPYQGTSRDSSTLPLGCMYS